MKTLVNKLVLSFYILFNTNSIANDTFGSFEVRRYFDTNIPEHLDRTGGDLKYGIDLRLYFPFLYNRMLFMLGATGDTGPSYFSQGGGRAGFILRVPEVNIEVAVEHFSLHNFDHETEVGPRFLNDNRISIRYFFGKDPLRR